MKTLKEQIQKDINTVFFNTNEFAEDINFNGTDITVIIEQNNITKVDDSEKAIEDADIILTVNKTDIKNPLKAKMIVKINNEAYSIEKIGGNMFTMTIYLNKVVSNHANSRQYTR